MFLYSILETWLATGRHENHDWQVSGYNLLHFLHSTYNSRLPVRCSGLSQHCIRSMKVIDKLVIWLQAEDVQTHKETLSAGHTLDTLPVSSAQLNVSPFTRKYFQDCISMCTLTASMFLLDSVGLQKVQDSITTAL